MNGVELQKVLEVAKILVGSVDSSDNSLVSLVHEGRSEDESTDTAETIDTHLSDFLVHMFLVHIHHEISVASHGRTLSHHDDRLTRYRRLLHVDVGRLSSAHGHSSGSGAGSSVGEGHST